MDSGNWPDFDLEEFDKIASEADERGFLVPPDADKTNKAETTDGERRPSHPLGLGSIPGYSVGARIGSGGYSLVYRGIAESAERDVAVKICLDTFLNESSLLRFDRETSLLKQLDHPNIVKLYEHGVTASGHAFLYNRSPQSSP